MEESFKYYIYHGMVGKSLAMKKIFTLIEHLKESSVNLLITGSSGTGKEMVAKALHATSPRKDKKFVAINCSAIPDNLLEGELFGYHKGAFTDAQTDKRGLFEEAEGGTLFLDEIGDMPLTLQPKILRALQEKEIRPLGSITTIPVNVRIITATNQDLSIKIKQNLFREDLYYRLNAMQIEIPPMSERKEDIPLLADYLVKKCCQELGKSLKQISPQAMEMLLEYSWPGNVRELYNTIERAIILSQNSTILPKDVLVNHQAKTQNFNSSITTLAHQKTPLADVEKNYILEVLHEAQGNRSQTAKILKIGRKTLYNKLSHYGV